MAPFAQPESPIPQQALWRTPRSWLREQNLDRAFWIFFVAAFFFDAGFSVHFFLFNLYLLDLHYNERWIGLIGGAMTLGSVAGTLPAGALARRFGIRPLLIFCFIAAPACGMLRAVWIWPPAQLLLAFAAGVSMCGWAVGFLPSIAALTNEENRAVGYSLVYSVSVACGALGAVFCGALPQWLSSMKWTMPDASVKRLILLASCAMAFIGLAAILRIPAQDRTRATSPSDDPPGCRLLAKFRLSPFLGRFLAIMSLWSIVLASFTPFANIYLARDLHIGLRSIGLIFAATQALQIAGALVNPLLFRFAGLVNGIAILQIATALSLGCIALPHFRLESIAAFLAFSAAQWMCTPGLYQLLMNQTPEAERSTAASITIFATSLVNAGSTASAGALFALFGYRQVLPGLGAFALAVALLGRIVLRRPTCSLAACSTDSGTAAIPSRRAG